jgi:protein-S-isoprenylcysteine O-methyltransferase Ste14
MVSVYFTRADFLTYVTCGALAQLVIRLVAGPFAADPLARTAKTTEDLPMLSLKSAVATIVVPGGACLLIPYFILTADHASLTPPFGCFQVIAIPIFVVGVYMVVWVSTAFVRQGKGTPVPIEPPTRLVKTGLYRYVRNPMYVGAILIVLAEAVYFSAIWLVIYAAGLWLLLHAFMIVFEEPQLKRRYGADYEQYLTEVPRWIPRFRIPSRRS